MLPGQYAHYCCLLLIQISFPLHRDSSAALPVLQPWDVLGYPTFSGAVVYRRGLIGPSAGDYVLDLGRVGDLAVVTVDGTRVAVLAWGPYRAVLPGLACGDHELEIEISNAPANRNRAAGLPAGLLGPVRLLHTPAQMGGGALGGQWPVV